MSEGKSRPRFSEAFHRGKESLKSNNPREIIKHAFILLFPLIVAWNSPLAWYWQIGLFVMLLLIIGVIIRGFASRQ